MWQRLVVPLDGSQLSQQALPYAALIARMLDARVVLLHARRSALLPDDEAPDLEAIAAPLRAEGVGVDISIYDVPPSDDVGRGILDGVAELGAGMIVMATHGRGGLGRLLFGSVADQIVRQATLPVLLIPPACKRLPLADLPLRILVPLDGSDQAESILEPLAALAQAIEATLVVLRVAQTIPMTLHGDECVRCRLARERGEEPDIEQVRAWSYVNGVTNRLRARGLFVEPLMEVGDPATTIGTIAQERGIDLIAMTTHGRGGVARLVLGSVASETLRLATVPMLLVRPEVARATALGQPGQEAVATHAPVTADLRVPVKVEDIMTRQVVTVDPSATLEDVSKLMLQRGIGAVPVVDDRGHIVGIVTESDFTGKECYVPFTAYKLPQVFGEWIPREGVEAIHQAARMKRVGEIMSAPVITAVESEPVSRLARRMIEHQISRMPVVRGATSVGMVTRHDLLRLMVYAARDQGAGDAARVTADSTDGARPFAPAPGR